MAIDPNVSEWLNLALRWVHVFAGILWIGQTYYFTWLDGRFAEDDQAHGEEPTARIWMVHSGGFYSVEQQKAPTSVPPKLWWFRWEAALTWWSGILLLTFVYYMGGLMVDADVAAIRKRTAVLIGLGAITAAWLLYDVLVRTPLSKSEAAFATVSFILIVAAAFGLTHVLSGRAAYMHVGAMFGTIMSANVWMRILPAQRRMIAAIREGKKPDLALGAQAKLRSKHNTFMAVPVVFIMISNHFPTASYGSRYNWVILAAFVLVGWIAAKIIRSG